MKKTRRFSALLLAVLMLTALLSGCQKEPPVPGDQVAVALFDMILKDDASSVVNLFGYADEAEAREDMGLAEGELYEGLADEMVTQFESMQMDVTQEDAQTFVDAFISMFKNVNMTAEVKESDEKAGSAVVTCTVDTFDANAMNDAMTQVMNDILTDEELLAGDEAAIYSALLNKISGAIADLTPSGGTADFDVDFELQTVTVNGKDREVWMPKDAEEFGELVATTALGQ